MTVFKVYIYVPTDVVGVPLDASRLETPLDTTIRNKDSPTEDRIVQTMLDLIGKSSNPAILADVLAIRHGGQELTRKLVELTHFPSYSTPLSKGVIEETNPYYNGLYNGQGTMINNAVFTSILIVVESSLLSRSQRRSGKFRLSA
jgi:pyruvate decarboxylase